MTKLKRRSAAVAKVKAVAVKRKRISVTRNRVAGKTDYTSGTTLVFPTDPSNLLVELRASLIAIASRMGTDETKLELLHKTYAVGLAHIEARLKHNQDTPVLVGGSRSARIQAAREAVEAELKEAIEAEAEPKKVVAKKAKK